MPSKYGFKTIDETATCRNTCIENGKHETIRIDPIVRDVLQDYKEVWNIDDPIIVEMDYPNRDSCFGKWALGNEGRIGIMVFLYDDFQRNRILFSVTGTWDSVSTIREVLTKAIRNTEKGDGFIFFE